MDWAFLSMASASAAPRSLIREASAWPSILTASALPWASAWMRNSSASASDLIWYLRASEGLMTLASSSFSRRWISSSSILMACSFSTWRTLASSRLISWFRRWRSSS